MFANRLFFNLVETAIIPELEGPLDIETGEVLVDDWFADLRVAEDIDDAIDKDTLFLDLEDVAPHHRPEGLVSATVMRGHGQELEHLRLLIAELGIEDIGYLRRMAVGEL